MNAKEFSKFRTFHSILWKTATVGWAVLIFELSTRTYGPSFSSGWLHEIMDCLHVTISQASFETIHNLLRKLAHPTEYAIFAMLLYGSSRGADPFAWSFRRACCCFLIAAAYSLTDEFHQRFVPGRGPALSDCGIDTLGAALGLLVYYVNGCVPTVAIGKPCSSRALRNEIASSN